MGDFTSEKEQKLLESEAEVSNTEDTNADNSLLKKYLDFQMMMTTVMKKRNRKRNSLDMTSKTRSSLSVSLR